MDIIPPLSFRGGKMDERSMRTITSFFSNWQPFENRYIVFTFIRYNRTGEFSWYELTELCSQKDSLRKIIRDLSSYTPDTEGIIIKKGSDEVVAYYPPLVRVR